MQSYPRPADGSDGPSPSDVLEAMLHDRIETMIRQMLQEIEQERLDFLTGRYARYFLDDTSRRPRHAVVEAEAGIHPCTYPYFLK